MLVPSDIAAGLYDVQIAFEALGTSESIVTYLVQAPFPQILGVSPQSAFPFTQISIATRYLLQQGNTVNSSTLQVTFASAGVTLAVAPVLQLSVEGQLTVEVPQMESNQDIHSIDVSFVTSDGAVVVMSQGFYWRALSWQMLSR